MFSSKILQLKKSQEIFQSLKLMPNNEKDFGQGFAPRRGGKAWG